MKKKFIIFAPSYDENIGGIIVLHYLCHLINHSKIDNVEAYIYPFTKNLTLTKNPIHNVSKYVKLIKQYLKNKINFKTNPNFNTPKFKGYLNKNDIVVYPEIVSGNPLNAKNIVRWLLHKPGFHTGIINYGLNELYFKFQDAFVNDFNINSSKLSDLSLYITYYPLELYNLNNTNNKRSGCAYSIRKGKNKIHNQHPNDAICIDGLSHKKIAKIFKTVERFISYDIYSAYMGLAVLCGCEVIAIPDEGISKKQWLPDERKRYGIAYGFNDLAWAKDTITNRIDFINSVTTSSQSTVDLFIEESLSYFNKKK